MDSLPLFKNNKERKFFFLTIVSIFIFNLFLEFLNYQTFITNEIYQTKGQIQNIYLKKEFQILKLKTKDFTFFTQTPLSFKPQIYQNANIYLLTTNIDFISYLKNFYSKNISIELFPIMISNKLKIKENIESQHISQHISSLYNALFLSAPLTLKLRETASKLGISHLIAISGYHLGVLSFILYLIIHFIYSKIHSKYYPYRNKRFDIMVVVSVLLYIYMIFIDLPASLLRAFVMFIFALYLLRSNIKLLSFETLLLITVFIIALFPKLLFSLSLWFSITGVFYIFLFIKYFKNLHKAIQFVLFNFWIYMTINPITHYFFATSSLEQLYSPILTMLFSIFYPLSMFLHIIDIGNLFDKYLETIVNLNINSIELFTPVWFFVFYVIVSLLAVLRKEFFVLLNILMILFNIWLFYFIF